jgi:hypothetical protein
VSHLPPPPLLRSTTSRSLRWRRRRATEQPASSCPARPSAGRRAAGVRPLPAASEPRPPGHSGASVRHRHAGSDNASERQVWRANQSPSFMILPILDSPSTLKQSPHTTLPRNHSLLGLLPFKLRSSVPGCQGVATPAWSWEGRMGMGHTPTRARAKERPSLPCC